MAISREVVVDDISDRISYQGTWSTDSRARSKWEEFGLPFGNTMHTTRKSGSFTLSFSGTSVTVYASNDVDSVGLEWHCLVDEIPVVQDGSGNPLVACLQERLVDGSHTLKVNVDISMSNETFYFDRVQYLPSPAANLENQVLLVQEADPIIQYDNGWTYDNTKIVRITTKNGATVKFSFTGISLAWYTFLSSDYRKALSTATYTIDGGAPEEFSFGGNPNEVVRYNQKIMQTRTLPMGKHEMVVTYNGGSTSISAPLSLDYLVIQNGTFPAASATLTTVGSTGTATDTATVALVSASTSSKVVLVGAIVGGVLGAIMIILTLVGFILWRRRRQQQQQQQQPSLSTSLQNNYSTTGSSRVVTPFTDMPRPLAPAKTAPTSSVTSESLNLSSEVMRQINEEGTVSDLPSGSEPPPYIPRRL